jgi:transposase
MTLSTPALIPQRQNFLDVAFDVSKDSLSYLYDLPGGESAGDRHRGQVVYRTPAVLAELVTLQRLATAHGFAGIRVVCEPTSGYEQRLLRLARQSGCRTALVNGESVYKLQVLESNDYNKTDLKDPGTILLVARLGKTLRHRHLDGDWTGLRALNARYDRLERSLTQCKNRIYKVLSWLFPDLSFQNDWLFDGPAVDPLLSLYGFDPFAMHAAGRAGFLAQLRRRGLRRTTIERLWADAARSVLQELDAAYRAVLVEDLRQLFEDLRRLQTRRAANRESMIQRVDQLRARGQIRLQAWPGLISPFLLARILAETGPLRDFGSISQLLRYAGLNLRQKQSGTFKGRERIGKKGRPRLRRALAQAALKRVVHGQLYGEYYHAKKAAGMCGGKAMTAVARKLLKLLFGLDKSGTPFDPARVFRCAVQPRAA